MLDPDLVGTYDAVAGAGGGFVWDEVLEYRVWMHPQRGAADEFEGDDYFYAFESCEEALEFANDNRGASPPLALILQREYINEVDPGVYEHVREERFAEWPVEFLSRPKRSTDTIPNFLAPDAPANRLAILRGEVRP